MHATIRPWHVYAVQLRWLARTSAEILVVLWAGFFAAELIRPITPHWPTSTLMQGALLGVIFAGYLIGWRREQLGGWMAIAGTATLATLLALTQAWTSETIRLAWFALPGVLYLMARHYDRRAAEPSA
jgi:hypothetical protein